MLMHFYYRYLMKYIHKQSFEVPFGVGVTELSALESIVTSFYREVKRDVSSVLAYKGGQCERRLLTSFGIPLLNLEGFCCPKAEALIGQLIWLEMCGSHI